MRRTMFVEPVELMPVVQAACTDAIAVQQRRLLETMVGGAGLADDPAGWVEEVEKAAVTALEAQAGRPPPRSPPTTPVWPSRSWSRRSRTRGPPERRPHPAAAGRRGPHRRGRPRGSWISGQYRWSVVDAWLPDGVADWSLPDAQTELVRRWLAGFGPATVADVKWWTGLPMGQVRKAVAAAGAVEVDLDGVPGLVLPDDLDPVPAPEPWVALLPALDPTTMGWAGRDFYLGPHRPVLFDRNGNAGPAIWWDGRVVGGWAQRRRRGRPAPPRGRRRRRHRRHRGRGGRLTTWLGGPGHPRFRTPWNASWSPSRRGDRRSGRRPRRSSPAVRP